MIDLIDNYNFDFGSSEPSSSFDSVSGGNAAGYAGMVTSISAAVTGAVSNYYAAKSQKQQLEYDQFMSMLNSSIQSMAAKQEIIKGQRAEQSLRLNAASFRAKQKVALAANGVALDEGSAKEILQTTDYMTELDATTIQENALRSAWGYETQSLNYATRSQAAKVTGQGISPAKTAGVSLLSDAPKVASNWLQYR